MTDIEDLEAEDEVSPEEEQPRAEDQDEDDISADDQVSEEEQPDEDAEPDADAENQEDDPDADVDWRKRYEEAEERAKELQRGLTPKLQEAAEIRREHEQLKRQLEELTRERQQSTQQGEQDYQEKMAWCREYEDRRALCQTEDEVKALNSIYGRVISDQDLLAYRQYQQNLPYQTAQQAILEERQRWEAERDREQKVQEVDRLYNENRDLFDRNLETATEYLRANMPPQKVVELLRRDEELAQMKATLAEAEKRSASGTAAKKAGQKRAKVARDSAPAAEDKFEALLQEFKEKGWSTSGPRFFDAVAQLTLEEA